MRVRILALAAGLGLCGIAAASAQMGGYGMGGGMGPGMQGGMMGNPRHVFYMHTGLPPDYAGKTDPLADTPAVLAEGRKLYAANCAACHGAEAAGDGPMANTLNPPPPNLAWTLSGPVAQDDFLYWTIAEGGAPFGSAMPAFKSTLKPNEIWSIVSALRSGELMEK